MQQRRGYKMIANISIACLLTLCLVFSGLANPPQRNPEAGKKKAAKRIGIGAAAGGAFGGLVGGRKGALIGAGIGAGGGTAYHLHKKRKAKRRHRH